MLQPVSTIFLIILCILIGYSLIKPWLSKDKTAIWSPITMISLTMIYYVIKPSFEENISLYGADIAPNQYLFFLTAVLFYCSVLFAFSRPSKSNFSRWNTFFTPTNVQKVAVVLFLIAMVCYVPLRGFRYSIAASDAVKMTERTGFVSYFIDLISIFVSAGCLAYVGLKNNSGLGFKKILVFYVILYFTLVLFIVGGFRYRLVFLILSLVTTYHLYPTPRKLNYAVLISVAIVAYLGFAIMDTSRSYGRGINLETAKNISLEDAFKGAGESMDVYSFSIVVTDAYSRYAGSAGIEPILTAVLMPIPRAILPSKPDASYIHEAEKRTGVSGGAAFLVFTEAYIAFGMIGVILYGLFIGWFCKKIWNNYLNNKYSIGAILLLALLNGFCYTWISRGYMASAFNDFIYFVILPFWITALINRFSKQKI